MARYHLSKQGPRPCNAIKRPCPVGGQESHFDSIEEAEAAFHASMGGSFAASLAAPVSYKEATGKPSEAFYEDLQRKFSQEAEAFTEADTSGYVQQGYWMNTVNDEGKPMTVDLSSSAPDQPPTGLLQLAHGLQRVSVQEGKLVFGPWIPHKSHLPESGVSQVQQLPEYFSGQWQTDGKLQEHLKVGDKILTVTGEQKRLPSGAEGTFYSVTADGSRQYHVAMASAGSQGEATYYQNELWQKDSELEECEPFTLEDVAQGRTILSKRQIEAFSEDDAAWYRAHPEKQQQLIAQASVKYDKMLNSSKEGTESHRLTVERKAQLKAQLLADAVAFERTRAAVMGKLGFLKKFDRN